jgi:hypothetical protein
MMDKCPRCGMYAVTYDAFRGVTRCLVDGCSCQIIDDKSYSILRANPSKKTIERVLIKKGEENSLNPEVLKSYKGI